MNSSSSASANDRAALALPILLTLVLIALKIAEFEWLGGSHLIWDSYWYLSLAENLQHTSYSLADGLPHLKYPPAFPLFIAALSSVVGSAEQAASALVFLSSLAVLALTFRLGSRYSVRVGCLAAILLALHHLYAIHSNLLLTEIFFSAFALWSLYLLLDSPTKARLSLAVLLAAIASLTRYEGLLLVPLIAWRAWQMKSALHERSSGKVLLVLSTVACLSAWTLWVCFLRRHGWSIRVGGYQSELGLWSFGRAVDFLTLAFWLGPIFVACAINGAYSATRTKSSAALIFGAFALLYLCCHALWWFSDLRFYVPLLPLFAVAAAKASDELCQKLPARSQLKKRAACVMLLVVFAAEQGSLFAPSSSDYRRYNSLYLTQYGVVADLGRWTADNTSAGTIAVPELTVYRRHLPERNLVSYEDFLSRMESLKAGGPLYVIVDNIHFRAEAIQAGLNGAMSLSRSDGSIVELRARTLKEFKNPLPGDTWNFAALLEVTDISVVPNKAT